MHCAYGFDQGLIQVFDEVVDILQADRNPNKVVRNAQQCALLDWHGRVRHYGS